METHIHSRYGFWILDELENYLTFGSEDYEWNRSISIYFKTQFSKLKLHPKIGCIGWVMVPQRYSILIPGTCKWSLIWKQGVCKCDWILKWGDYPGISEWALNAITYILIRGQQQQLGQHTITGGHREERDLKMLTLKTGVMQLQAKQCQQPPKAVRGKEFSSKASRGSADPKHLDISPVKLNSDFWLPNLWQNTRFCCFKPPSLW